MPGLLPEDHEFSEDKAVNSNQLAGVLKTTRNEMDKLIPDWATADDLTEAEEAIVSSAVSKLNTLTAPPDLSNITQQIQGLSDLLNSRLPSFVVTDVNASVPTTPCLKVLVDSDGNLDSIWYDDGLG